MRKPTRSNVFRDALRDLRSLNPTFTAYDTAVLLACVKAIEETVTAAESVMAESSVRIVSVRTIAYHIAHRALADTICSKYGVAFLVPDVVQSYHLHKTIRLPLTSVLPGLPSLIKRDYKENIP